MSNSKFMQIAKIIERDIELGIYPPNSRLPTHRRLAEELETTPVTVAKAYKLLIDKGQLESFVGRGTFVCSGSDLEHAIQAKTEENNFNFSILQPCLELNVSTLKDAYRQSAEKISSAVIGYIEHSGHEVHRAAGAKWAQNFGLEGANSRNILLTNGAQHALSLVIDSFTKPGDTILVEKLTYPGITSIAHMSGRKVVGLELDADGLCPKALSDAIDEHQPSMVIVIPSHQNPTGISMPVSRKKEIAKIINNKKIWLVEDDIYAFLDDETTAPIANFAPDYTFHISALSKAISPAMRCGYLKVPQSQITVANSHIRTNIWFVSPINFIAATQLIESGEAFRLAMLQRETANQRQDLVKKLFPSLNCSANGYHVWLPLPSHWHPDRFSLEAKNKNIIVTSGSYFCTGSNMTNHVRLSLMSIRDESRLLEGLSEIKLLMESDANNFFPY